MEVTRVSHPSGILKGEIELEGSKSLSNRYLIINQLCPKPFVIHKLSASNDTQILDNLLQDTSREVYDVHHAGTSFRFLTAFLAIKEGTQVLTGSSRMKERPISALVDALQQIGCQIEYIEKDGYPPLKIHTPQFDDNNKVRISAGISSQYLSALIMIGPKLPQGIEIILEGDLVSESYLNMTLKTVSEFGVQYVRSGNTVKIAHQEYRPRDVVVEADWSASSYYYALCAFAKEAHISLSGLFEHSIQGDSKMVEIGRLLGINSRFKDGNLILTKTCEVDSFEYDFINQPDLAQTIAVICSAKGISAKMTGLKTLRIKETDRIVALDQELKKLGSAFNLLSGEGDHEIYGPGRGFRLDHVPRFSTYRDHRMGMAFGALATLGPIEIESPQVVGKSYPAYWSDLESLGFMVAPVGE